MRFMLAPGRAECTPADTGKSTPAGAAGASLDRAERASYYWLRPRPPRTWRMTSRQAIPFRLAFPHGGCCRVCLLVFVLSLFAPAEPSGVLRWVGVVPFSSIPGPAPEETETEEAARLFLGTASSRRLAQNPSHAAAAHLPCSWAGDCGPARLSTPSDRPFVRLMRFPLRC